MSKMPRFDVVKLMELHEGGAEDAGKGACWDKGDGNRHAPPPTPTPSPPPPTLLPPGVNKDAEVLVPALEGAGGRL